MRPERGSVRSVNVDDLPWRPSTMASGVFVKDIAVTDGWEMQLAQPAPGPNRPNRRRQPATMARQRVRPVGGYRQDHRLQDR